MPSHSFNLWNIDRRQALDQIAAAHLAVGGAGPGRRYATHQINQAYAMLLSSQFQGFCRDLHSETVDHICGPAARGSLRMLLLRRRCTTGRKLNSGNPNPGNIGADFGFFDLELWPALKAHDSANELEHFPDWCSTPNLARHGRFSDHVGRLPLQLPEKRSKRIKWTKIHPQHPIQD
jgi:hypothetical protein